MDGSFAFEPDAARARRLDRTMLSGLADSLQHLREAADGAVPFDASAIDALIGRLRNGERHGPVAFATYYDLVPALVEERWSDAEALFATLASLSPIGAGLACRSFAELERVGQGELFRSKLDTDPDVRFHFLEPPERLVEPFRQRFERGMALLDRTVPELSGEVRGLLSDVLLAVGPEGAGYIFDGGSSYMLWGALVLNPTVHETIVQVAEVIAHESAHTLLFGFTVDEPLTYNDDTERFTSPLRDDPRPMDGIYHATFVSARMHWVMTQLAQSGALDAEEMEAARRAAARDAANFAAGYDTVAQFARLSPPGSAIIAEAKAYMDRAA